MPAFKTWTLAALGLAVSAPIDLTLAQEINQNTGVTTPTLSDPLTAMAPAPPQNMKVAGAMTVPPPRPLPSGEGELERAPGATFTVSTGGPPDPGRGETAEEQPEQRPPGASPIASVISAFLQIDVAQGQRLRLPKVDQRELESSVRCLALNIYHEARAEPERGQQAVAAVTLNRVASPAFPHSVCQVVKQGGKKLNRCQFSWWCDRRSDEPRETAAWNRALAISRKALRGEISDPTGGALYYHATRVKPRWARTFDRTGQIGRHIFYRPQEA